MTDSKKVTIQQLKSATPEFFFALEDLAENAIQTFVEDILYESGEIIDVNVVIDVDVKSRIRYSVCINLSQGSLDSKPLFESEFSESAENTSIKKVAILLLNHVNEVVCPAERARLNIILPNQDRCSENDLTTEIKRSVEWFYAIKTAMSVLTYRESLEGERLPWSEICVRMSEDKRIGLKQAITVVTSHLRDLIHPYAKIAGGAFISTFQCQETEPMEQALILRILASNKRFLESLPEQESRFLCSFLWNNRNVATYKSKFELFQKYVTDEILGFAGAGFSEIDLTFDIFNFTEVLLYNPNAIHDWIMNHTWTDDEMSYIANVFGNGGYENERHYLLAAKTLGMIFEHASERWQDRINQYVFDGSEIEEMHEWASASNQTLPEIALECVLSASKTFQAFGKGIIILHGLEQTVPLIKKKEQVRKVCFLFNTSPDKIIEVCPSDAERAQVAITELILEGF